MSVSIQDDVTLEEKTQWVSVIVLWLIGIFAAMQFAKFSISYEVLIQNYKVSSASIGTLLSIVGMVGLVFGVVAGVLSGKLGYRRVLISALIIGCGLSLFQSTLPAYNWMLASRVLEGISHLGLVVVAPTLMLRFSAPNHHSLVMGVWGTFFGVAFAVSGWLGSMILNLSGLSGLSLSHAAISIPLLVYVWFFTSEDRAEVTPSKVIVLSDLIKSTLQVYLNPRTCLPGVIFFFHTSMFIAFLTFVPRLTDDDEVRNALLILLPVVSILGTFLAGFLSQYLLRPPSLVFFAYLGVLLTTYSTIQLQGSSEYFVLSAVLLLLISGIVQGASFTLIPFLSENEYQQAMGNGAIAQLGNLGATVGVPIFAFAMVSSVDYGFLFVVTGLCMAGCVVALFLKKYQEHTV
ncbi:MFS transporter [Marinomonas sp. 2405UD68-3]|uniref:MFS transporter n=1 Tax=Marinomonas sp. 2405UD68-3 TaxID=3391835 RepID=UPI0039C970A9